MTAQAVIAEIEALPVSERAKVFAFVGEAMTADNSPLLESVQASRLDRVEKPFVISTLDELEAKLDEGIAELDRGEGIPGGQVFDELAELSRQRRLRHG